MKTKLCAMVAGTSLLFSQTCFCNNTQTKADAANAKYKKHLAVGAYSILGAYSVKKTLDGLFLLMTRRLYFDDVAQFFPQTVKALKSGHCSQFERMIVYYGTFLCNLAKTSLFSYLTYFAAKNIIQELENTESNADQGCQLEVNDQEQESAI